MTNGQTPTEQDVTPFIKAVYGALDTGMPKLMGAKARDIAKIAKDVYVDVYMAYLGTNNRIGAEAMLETSPIYEKLGEAVQHFIQNPYTNSGVWGELNQAFFELYLGKYFPKAIEQNGIKLEGKDLEMFEKQKKGLESKILGEKLRTQIMGDFYRAPEQSAP